MVQQFTNELFGNVRVIEVNGNLWFVGRDITSALGYIDSINAIKQHVDPRDKWDGGGETPPPPITFIDSLGRQQTQVPVWINESGLYSLIFGSRLPAATEFKHWVTSEVLPTMRKIGFTRSMQYLQEENQRLKGLVEGYESSNFMANVDRSEVVDMRNQMIEKVMLSHSIPADEKQFIIQYNPNWNNE